MKHGENNENKFRIQLKIMLLEVNRVNLDIATRSVTFRIPINLMFTISAKLRSDQIINIHSAIQSKVLRSLK
jgi:hypothetical protein